MSTTNQQLQLQVKQELDDITLSVVAYHSKKVLNAIVDANSLSAEKREISLRKDFQKSLETMRDGKAFSPERTQEIMICPRFDGHLLT